KSKEAKMKRNFLWVTCILLLLSFTIISWKAEAVKKNHKHHSIKIRTGATSKELFSAYIEDIYNTAELHATGLDYSVFQKAVVGYFNLKASNQVPQTSSVITVVDLAKS